MVETMEGVHPDLYFSFSRDEAQFYMETVKEKLTDGLTRIEFYALAAPLAVRFND